VGPWPTITAFEQLRRLAFLQRFASIIVCNNGRMVMVGSVKRTV
jgi:hypothetical protein